MSVKQVIIIRKDLKMRRGKEIAQGAHASISFMVKKLAKKADFTKAEKEWIESGFAKITLQVNSEEEIIKLHEFAKVLCLESHLITDSGKTEFDGKPTITALAIGPDEDKVIDMITGELKLY